ncbi:MAG: Zn-dependent alcohol dehydrogenase, partial [Pseudomonadota bacterium]
KLAACAVCHSDISAADGDWGSRLPAVFGHEAAGVVVALGEGVAGFALGERVLVTLIRHCGTCPNCEAGEPTSCDHAYEDPPTLLRDAAGGTVQQAINCGAFAERVVVHESQCVGLPDDIPMEAAALLACGVITGVGAVVNTAKMRPGASVAVIGAGGVGLNTIQGAAIAGASRIIAIDLLPEKLEVAREFGATDGVDASAGDVAEAVRALTGGRGVAHVFVTVGAPPAFASAPDLLAPGGSVTLVGMPPSEVTIPYSPVMFAAMNHSLQGSRMGQAVIGRDIPWLITLWRQGRLKLEALITGRYRLEEINEAIAATRTGAARRNVIIFD